MKPTNEQMEDTTQKESSQAEQESREQSDWGFLSGEIDLMEVDGRVYIDATHFQSMLRYVTDRSK